LVDRVDVVVVGGGLSGLTATAALAQSGVPVRLYDRRGFEGRPGGGLVAGTSLAPLGGPSMRQEPPFERQVLERRWLFLSEEGDAALDFLDGVSPMPTEGFHTVRTATLAPWLADRARRLGADLRPNAPVESLQRDGKGRVTGVVVGGEVVEARITILADAGGLRTVPNITAPPPTVAVAEATWRLSEAKITARFGGRPGHGAVLEVVLGPLDPTGPAGAYLLPYREEIAVGVVARYDPSHPEGVHELLERLERHPSIAPLLAGGTRTEVRRFALGDRPDPARPLSGPGFLAAGTAGGLMAATPTRFRATEAAIRSGSVVAEAARLLVSAQGDPAPLALNSYRLQLRSEGILEELRRARLSGERFRAAPGVGHDVPRYLNALLHELFTEDGGPKRKVLPTVREVRRRERLRRRTLPRLALVAWRWV
jgi:electron transfer flavoprotein-quinone oxidoreductase